MICDAAIVLLLMLRRGEGEGQGEWGRGGGRGLTKLKSYSVGHAAAALLSLHLFYWMKKIQILINKCIKNKCIEQREAAVSSSFTSGQKSFVA